MCLGRSVSAQGGECGDAQGGTTVGHEVDRFFGGAARAVLRTPWQGAGLVVVGLPMWQADCPGLEGDGCVLEVPGGGTDGFAIDDLEAGYGVSQSGFQECVVPGAGRADLPETGLLGPLFFDPECEDQGAAFDGEAVFVPPALAEGHRQGELHGVAIHPEPGEAGGLTGDGGNGLTCAVHGDPGAFAPEGNAQVQREIDGLVGLNGEADGLFERVSGFGDQGHLLAVGHPSGDCAWCVGQRGEPVICRGHPEVLDELGPTLVEVACTAWVSAQKAVHVSIDGVIEEIVHGGGASDLVGLLEVLARGEVVVHLGGEHIECEFLELVGECEVPGDFEHFLE